MYNVTVYALLHDAAVAPYFGFFRRLAMVLALPCCARLPGGATERQEGLS